jgi:hypothetical protein
MQAEQANQDIHAFTAEARDAIYQTIFSRRDVRGQFLPNAVPDEVLSRIICWSDAARRVIRSPMCFWQSIAHRQTGRQFVS